MNSATRNVIKEIFESMDYCSKNVDIHTLTFFQKWFRSEDKFNYFDSCSECFSVFNVNDFTGYKVIAVRCPKLDCLDEFSKQIEWNNSSVSERVSMMIALIEEIKTNSELICELEFALRGILCEDTKNKVLLPMIAFFKCSTEKVVNSVENKRYIFVADDCFLGYLGYILCDFLIHGQPTILLVEPQMVVQASLFIKFCWKIGVPKKAISLIPFSKNQLDGNLKLEHETFVYGSFNYDKIKHIDRVFYEDEKLPIIVFNNSDLDSACHVVLEAVWSYCGLLPYTANVILVQEDVLEEFTNKLEHLMKKTNSLHVPKKITEKLDEMRKEAALNGIKIIRSCCVDGSELIVFVGGLIYANNVLGRNKARDVPHACVLAFRNANEAVALANNLKQGIGASIWTENIGLANEVASKLNVANVWMNSYGLFQIDRQISSWRPVKGNLKKIETWAKLSYFERKFRVNKLLNLVLSKNENSENKSYCLFLKNCFSKYERVSNCSMNVYEGKYLPVKYLSPKGVIDFVLKKDAGEEEEIATLDVMLGALLLGNGVLFRSKTSNLNWIPTEEMTVDAEIFAGVFRQTNEFNEASNVVELQLTPSEQMLMKLGVNTTVFTNKLVRDAEDLCNVKIVWQNVGDSFL